MSRNEAALAKDKAGGARDALRHRAAAPHVDDRNDRLPARGPAVPVDRLRAVAEFQQNVLRSLQVRAGDSGVVSDLTLQLGQYVLGGTMLAKVVQPGNSRRCSRSRKRRRRISRSVRRRRSTPATASSRARDPVRSQRDQRHRGSGRCARGHGRGDAARPVRRRHDRDRATRARALHGEARVRPAEQHDRDVQDHRRRTLREPRAGSGGAQLGEHDRGNAWPERCAIP